MSYTHFERLSAMDSVFLAIEDECTHMHIGGVSIFESGPLATEGGGIDIGRIRHLVDVQLHKAPRFRQKLAYTPISGAPVWVDDRSFNLDYHVRHASLPHPGGATQLRRLASRVMSQRLDRRRPLWELWFVEGLEDGRFAMISKIHHCMADGISGVAIMAAILGPNPDYRPGASQGWIPRPAPDARELLAGDLRHYASTMWDLVRSGVSPSREASDAASSDTDESVAERLRKAGSAMLAAVESSPATPLNADIGMNRRFAWWRIGLDRIDEIRKAAGGKLNDVVLTIVSGAVRGFLMRRGCTVAGLDFTAMVPVSVRRSEEAGSLGNRISQMLVHLPIDEEDPLVRLRIIHERTQQLKKSGMVAGGQMVSSILELIPAGVAASIERAGVRGSFGNMVVTNVPGTPYATYLCGAKLVESYPLVPLSPSQALNIAVLSYDGFLHWGINADYDAIPDVDDFVALLAEEADRLPTLPVPV